MKFAEYIPLAVRTCKPLPVADHINHMGLGIVGEMGEIVDQLKKAYIYGKPLDQVNIVEEVGDVAYYVACVVQFYPNLHNFIESDELKNGINHERLAAAKAQITRTILLNTMSAANLVVDLGVLADEAGGPSDEGEEVAKTLCMLLYATAVLLDVDLAQAFEVNIAKLAKRYGDKYSDYAAVNRDTDAERAVLEAGTATGETAA